jgi:hypothetical protein
MGSRRTLRGFPPTNDGRCELVVVAASAGGVPALQALFAGLPQDFPVPVAAPTPRTTWSSAPTGRQLANGL